MVVHGDHSIHAGELEHLGVETSRKRLPIELLEVFVVSWEMGLAVVLLGATILCAVEEVGLDEHYRGSAVVLRRTSDQHVAHRKVVAASDAVGRRDDDDRLALEL